MTATVAELTWLIGHCKKLGITIMQSIDLYYDSKVVIQIAANPIFCERKKHIDIYFHFIREKLQQELIKTHHISTQEQLVHLFTKGLKNI